MKIPRTIFSLVIISCLNSVADPSPKLFPPYPKPKVKLDCDSNERGQIEFNFKKGLTVQSINSMEVWEEGSDKYLWKIRFIENSEETFVYGEVTDDFSIEQIYPENGISPRLPDFGKRFIVSIEVDYKTYLPPSIAFDNMSGVFERKTDGTIKKIKEGTSVNFERPSPSQLNGWFISSSLLAIAIIVIASIKFKRKPNQQVDPIVTTPVDEVEPQSTQGHP